METSVKDIAVQKITEMPMDQVKKVLIFMAGMEAENKVNNLAKNVVVAQEAAVSNVQDNRSA